MELGKQAVEVHKQVLESLKTPSEIAKNLGVADYYRAGARLHEYHASAQYVADQVMIHAAGPLAQAQAQKEIMDYKDELETRGAEALVGRKAPAILAKMTGMTDMGEIAKYFGRNNLAHMLQIAEQMQARLAAASQNKSNQEFTKLLTLHEKYSKDVMMYEEKVRSAIPIEKWNAMTDKERMTAQALGGVPMTKSLQDALNTAIQTRDGIGQKLYGAGYMPTPTAPPQRPIINVTPPGGAAPPGPGAQQPPTRGWIADLYNWMTKERVPEETVDKYRQIQNPHGTPGT